MQDSRTWIHRCDGNLFLFGGLYANEHTDDNGVTASFTILTVLRTGL